ncbi:uncharacterized protein VTP21DRAFT_4132 [Calcarisporiella thermophila]|uniref:uncharacterized protein n=1 Tax=Calcarisporiella thermophila TaxID=911321 RepID=UPI003743D6EB
MSPKSAINFYNHDNCPYAHRVATTLKELGIVPDETFEIDLDNKPEWYFKINPQGKVPSLKEGDTILIESLVIVEYLLEKYGKDQGCFRRGPSPARPVAYLCEKEHEAFLKGLREINDALVKQSNGPYFLGDQFTYADIAAAPFFVRYQLLQEVGFHVPETKEYERVNAYAQTVISHPSVKATTPSKERLLDLVRVFKNLNL